MGFCTSLEGLSKGEFKGMNKYCCDACKKEIAVAVYRNWTEERAKLIGALESASQALHYVLRTRDHFATRDHVDAVLMAFCRPVGYTLRHGVGFRPDDIAAQVPTVSL